MSLQSEYRASGSFSSIPHMGFAKKIGRRYRLNHRLGILHELNPINPSIVNQLLVFVHAKIAPNLQCFLVQ